MSAQHPERSSRGQRSIWIGSPAGSGPEPASWQEACRRGHPHLRGLLGAADPLELGRRLHPPPRFERPCVRRERDPVGAQPIGHQHRELGVDDRRGDPHPRGGAAGELELELAHRDAALPQLAESELVQFVKLDVGSDRGDSVTLEDAGHHVAAPVDDPEQQRVADRKWELVAQRRVAFGIAVDQEVVSHRPTAGRPRQEPRSRA
jgi:hypothetical protein